MSDADLSPFFEPEGVAIVGARRSPGFGHAIPIVLKRLGWGERMYLVNPSGGRLHGKPLYGRVSEVPDPVDLAVVIVPAPAVVKVLEEIGDRGIKHVIVESAGFAETGESGKELQNNAEAVAKERGIRVVGPNCVGVVNTVNRFTTVEIIDEALTPGTTSIIAQSGVFGNVLLDMVHQYGLYISKAVTLGNRMDVNECDVLDYLLEDDSTSEIVMYLEGAADGERLRDTLKRVNREKPVLVLKSGRTTTGSHATASHTGSMSGEDSLYDAVFRQTGTIRAVNLEELVEMARVMATQELPAGNRLGVVTSSGSLGVMATDTAIACGLEVPPISDTTVWRIREEAPQWMNVRNPLDVGPSTQYSAALEAMLQDPAIDMVLAITIVPFAVFREMDGLGIGGESWFGDISALHLQARGKPLVVCAVGHSEFVDKMKELCGERVPVFISPEPAVRALAALYRYGRWRAGEAWGADRRE